MHTGTNKHAHIFPIISMPLLFGGDCRTVGRTVIASSCYRYLQLTRISNHAQHFFLRTKDAVTAELDIQRNELYNDVHSSDQHLVLLKHLYEKNAVEK